MKKSLHDPTNLMLYLLLSTLVSYLMYEYTFKYSENSSSVVYSIVTGLLISLIPLLVLDILSSFKNNKDQVDETTDIHFSGLLTHVDGLPYGCIVSIKGGKHSPIIEDTLHSVIFDFGNLKVIFSPNGNNISVTKTDKNVSFFVTNGRGTSFRT